MLTYKTTVTFLMMTESQSKARILKCLFSELPLFYILLKILNGSRNYVDIFILYTECDLHVQNNLLSKGK
jgi:hypothetical protein